MFDTPDTFFSIRATELQAEQVDRYLASKKTASQFLSEPFEAGQTQIMLSLMVEHKMELARRFPDRKL